MSTHATTRSPSDDDARIPDHSTIELRVRPRPDGPVRIDEVVDVLRGGRVVAAVVDGSASGDGCVVAVLAAGEDERVLISSAGDLQPGPAFEDVARQVRWYDRRRLAPVTGQVGVGPRTTSVLDDPAGTPASRLAAELGSTGYRDVPETGRVDAASRAALESLPLVPETLLADAAAALGIPAGLAELVEDVDQEPSAAPGRWLTAPGAEQVEPESSAGGAISRGIYAILTEEPQGDGRYARYRRWLWHRPGVLVAVSAAEAAVGAALCVAAASGVSIGGVVWPLWAAGALVLLDAVPDLANGVLLLRLRAKARPRPAA